MEGFKSYTKADMRDPEMAVELADRVLRNYNTENELLRHPEFLYDVGLSSMLFKGLIMSIMPLTVRIPNC